MAVKHLICGLLLLAVLPACRAIQLPTAGRLPAAVPTDSLAERMLLYQRDNGGWPQPGGDAIDYRKPISDALRQTLLASKSRLDATIDDRATTLEIRQLLEAWNRTRNPAYRDAAQRGVRYLLQAQNQAGGWPQFYPDSSGYHKHITFNDQAMVNVLWVMADVAARRGNFADLDAGLAPRAEAAVSRGIDCILKTQVVQNGVRTVWCAQHDSQTLKPAKARAFELPSLSGNESVGIVQFLMSRPNPTPAIRQAVDAAVAWFERSKLVGIRVQDVADARQPKGHDRVVVADPGSVLWARFYDLDTNRPFFTGRNSVPRPALADIENERRVGYAYYGIWPAKLLSTDYPAWVNQWGK